MFRIGIIGLSGFSTNHWQNVEEVQRRGGCRIVATAVVDPENHAARLEQLRSEGVEVFSSALEMFDAMRGKMDAVTIPTPIHTHPELTIAAVRSGYHVFLEKPPAATIQELDEMVSAVRRAGKLCAVGFQAIWSPSIQFLKLRLAEGAIGQVQSLACSAGWIRQADYYARAGWAGKLQVNGQWVLDGSANNPLAHQIANMLYLASPDRRRMATPAAVRAELYHGHDLQSEDTAAIEIHTAEGPRCYFLATLCADEQFHPEIAIVGSEGTAYYQMFGQSGIRHADGRIEQPTLDDSVQGPGRFENFISAASANDLDMLRCHLEMCRPFVLAINGAFESSRRTWPIPAEYLRVSGEGMNEKTVIEGIDAAIPQAASQRRLFSDLGLPWARRSGTFDLTGYTKFPQQFQPGPEADKPAPGQLPFG